MSHPQQHPHQHSQHRLQQGPDQQVERLVLTTVVKYTEWTADPDAVLATAHTKVRERAAQHGLLVQGQPSEQVESLRDSGRMRITLSVDAVPERHDPHP